MTDHECAAEGCTARIGLSMLMCRRHWAKVPRALQREVYRQWNRGAPLFGYLDVVDRAVAAVR